MRMAVVKKDTDGETIPVENVIEDGGAGWRCPDDCKLVEAGQAGYGWLWDGTNLIRPPAVPVSRLRTLMKGETEVRLADGVTEPKDAETLAAESAELLDILLGMMNAGQQLSDPQLQKLVQLNIAKGG